jgi:predicted amidohydrolase
MKFKLALVQMNVLGGRKCDNLRNAVVQIAQAAQAGADVILLPEAMPLGWTHPLSRELADAIPNGRSCQALREAARRHGKYVCAGVIEKAIEPAYNPDGSPDGNAERVYNAAVLIDPRGEVILHHRKLNELEVGHGCYDQGDRLGVANTPWGRFGLMICADANTRGQALTRSLGMMGADVILSPAAWAVPADHDNQKDPYGTLWREQYKPVARDFRLWIAGVSNVGKVEGGDWDGWNCIGCSLVIAPGGREVVQGPYGVDAETILYVDVEPGPRPARGTGWEKYWKNQEAPSSRGL